jgi:ABC-2 type transport system permease protein
MFRSFYILFLIELRVIARARATLFWVVLFPFFFLTLMMVSYGLKSQASYSATVVLRDLDKTHESARYLDTLRATLKKGPLNVDVQNGGNGRSPEGDSVMLTVPKGFSSALKEKKVVDVKVEFDLSSHVIEQAVQGILSAGTVYYENQMAGVRQTVHLNQKITVVSKAIDIVAYMLTGVLVMSMMSSGMNSICIAIAERRERGNFKALSSLPMNVSLYLLAMLLARAVLLFCAGLTLLVVGNWVFHAGLILTPAKVVAASVVTVVGAMMLLSLGVSLSSRMSSAQNAIFVCNMVYLSLLFLSDLTMPFSSFPAGAREVLMLLPTAQFVAALRGVLFLGKGITDQWQHLFVMLGWTLVFMGIGRTFFHWHRT